MSQKKVLVVSVVVIAPFLCLCKSFLEGGVTGNTYVFRARHDIRCYDEAVKRFAETYHRLPASLQELTERQPNGDPSLLDEKILLDPWQQPYKYAPKELDGKTGRPLIWSSGPPGENMPIKNWFEWQDDGMLLPHNRPRSLQDR